VSLSEYRKKRDPKKTSEPFSSGERSSPQPIFVVQRHDASRLHYDFRLEKNGALASWAVPKGVPLEPGAKALAVHVEDHPLEYATFHGEIPKGQYGGGTVEIFDNGTYELLEEKPNGQLTFDLNGQKLKGRWSLVPAHMDGKEQNWLLIKRHDDHDVGSVVQGTYKPMLATLDTNIPHGDDWAYEVKFDGFRAVAYIRGGECKLVSRNDNDLTGRFPEVARAIVKAVKSPNAVIDGEITRLDPTGKTSFSELQQGEGPLVYYAFDLLELDGASRIDLALTERKAQLRELLLSEHSPRLAEKDKNSALLPLEVLETVAHAQKIGEGESWRRLAQPNAARKRPHAPTRAVRSRRLGAAPSARCRAQGEAEPATPPRWGLPIRLPPAWQVLYRIPGAAWRSGRPSLPPPVSH